MALTAAQQAWLNEDNHRIVLLDLQYHNGTAIDMLRFSSDPYVMVDGDTTPDPLGGPDLSDLLYDDIVSKVPNIVTRIDSDSTIGSIELLNVDGEFDDLLRNYTVIGHTLELYIGQEDWARDDFIQILNGVVDGISSPSTDKIQLSIRDSIERLNVPLQPNLFTQVYWDTLMDSVDGTVPGDIEPGTQTYTRSLAVLPEGLLNTHIPLLFGKCFNITPVLVDSYNHVYLIAEEGISALPEVRANGIILNSDLNIPNTGPKQYAYDNTLGVLRLLDHSQGTQITCDVVGVTSRSSLATGATYTPTVHSAAFIIEWLLLEKASLDITELSADTFPSTGFDNISPLGIYYQGEDTVLTVVTKIINSVGGFIRYNVFDSVIELYKFTDPLGMPVDLTLIDDDVEEDGLSISSIEEPKQSITFGYKKNWSVQDQGSLAGAISDITSPYYDMDRLNLFINEFSSLYQETGITTTQYPLAEHTDLIESFIFEQTDASTELTRRIGLRSTRRVIYKIKSIASSFTYKIGNIVNLTYSRYGFDNGQNALIVGIEESPTTRRVNLEVWL